MGQTESCCKVFLSAKLNNKLTIFTVCESFRSSHQFAPASLTNIIQWVLLISSVCYDFTYIIMYYVWDTVSDQQKEKKIYSESCFKSVVYHDLSVVQELGKDDYIVSRVQKQREENCCFSVAFLLHIQSTSQGGSSHLN